MTLTEQWKNGELPLGYYYVETTDGGQVIDRYYRDCVDYDTYEYGNVWSVLFEDAILEVLAPAPNYEELEELKIDNHNLKAWIKHFQPKYKKMEAENQQLKEQIKLLKEAIYDLDGLECPKCGNYHRRGWTCSQCGYGK